MYALPGTLNTQGTSLGYGQKSQMGLNSMTPGPGSYQVSQSLRGNGINMGLGRQVTGFRYGWGGGLSSNIFRALCKYMNCKYMGCKYMYKQIYRCTKKYANIYRCTKKYANIYRCAQYANIYNTQNTQTYKILNSLTVNPALVLII